MRLVRRKRKRLVRARRVRMDSGGGVGVVDVGGDAGLRARVRLMSRLVAMSWMSLTA